MHGYNLVAIYPTLDEARRVSDRLLAEGVSPADVRLTDAALTDSTAAMTDVPREPQHEGGGVFNWLFASDVPDHDRDRYSAHLNEKRVAVSVRAADQHRHDRIIAMREEFTPIDIEEDGHAITTERSTPATTTGTSTFGAISVPAAGTTPQAGTTTQAGMT